MKRINLVGGDQGLLVEGDECDGADLGACWEARGGSDAVGDEALAAPGGVLGGQETGEDVGRKAGGGVNGIEAGAESARGNFEVGLEPDLEGAIVVGHGQRLLVVLGGDIEGDIEVAEAEAGEVERREVEEWIDGGGDDDLLRGSSGPAVGRDGRAVLVDTAGSVVLELDSIGEGGVGGDKVLRAEAGGAEEVVGVGGAGVAGAAGVAGGAAGGRRRIRDGWSPAPSGDGPVPGNGNGPAAIAIAPPAASYEYSTIRAWRVSVSRWRRPAES
jgi:hypothetical protein